MMHVMHARATVAEGGTGSFTEMQPSVCVGYRLCYFITERRVMQHLAYLTRGQPCRTPFVIAFIFAATPGLAVAESAGDLKEVKVAPHVTIRMRFCPEGRLETPKDPRAKILHREPIPVAEFWISESEVSRGQFASIMGAAPVREIGGRIPDKRIRELHFESKDDRFPIYAVSAAEAIEFCRRLVDAGSRNHLMTSYFRLPTTAEWRYACVANQAGYLFFREWPSAPLSFLKGKKLEDVWRQEWAGDGSLRRNPATFHASQADIADILDAPMARGRDNVSADRRQRLIAALFQNAIGLNYKFNGTVGDLETISSPAHQHEPWNIRHLHGNVSEWTIEVDPLDAKATWLVLASSVQAGGNVVLPAGSSDPMPQPPGFVVCGGGFNVLWKNWRNLTTWGGIRLTYATATDEFEHPETQYLPGVRVLRVESLKEDWLDSVRALVVRDPFGPGTLTQLDEDEAVVGRFSRGTKELDRQVILFYKLLARTRAEDPGGVLRLHDDLSKAHPKSAGLGKDYIDLAAYIATH